MKRCNKEKLGLVNAALGPLNPHLNIVVYSEYASEYTTKRLDRRR